MPSAGSHPPPAPGANPPGGDVALRSANIHPFLGEGDGRVHVL